MSLDEQTLIKIQDLKKSLTISDTLTDNTQGARSNHVKDTLKANSPIPVAIANCLLCRSDNPGVYWCTVCMEYLCVECKMHHRGEEQYLDHILTLAEGNVPALEFAKNELKTLKVLIVSQHQMIAKRLERGDLENKNLRDEMKKYRRSTNTNGFMSYVTKHSAAVVLGIGLIIGIIAIQRKTSCNVRPVNVSGLYDVRRLSNFYAHPAFLTDIYNIKQLTNNFLPW